jgi:hypothetical protein
MTTSFEPSTLKAAMKKLAGPCASLSAIKGAH